jgi:hypothetical protein
MASLPNGFDFVGTDVPLRFKRGQRVEILAKVTDDDGNILDITGRTYQAKIGTGSGTVATATFSYTVTDGPGGLVQLTLDTGAVVAGTYVMEVWENNTNFLWGGPVEVLDKDVA